MFNSIIIDKHPMIKDLHICIDNLNAMDVPSLVSIGIFGVQMSANEAIDIMSKFQYLRKFNFSPSKVHLLMAILRHD